MLKLCMVIYLAFEMVFSLKRDVFLINLYMLFNGSTPFNP